MMNTLKKLNNDLIFFLILLILLSCSFVFTKQLNDSVLPLRSLILPLILSFGFVFKLMSEKEQFFNFDIIHIILILSLAVQLISTLNSINLLESINEIIKIISFISFILFFSQIILNKYYLKYIPLFLSFILMVFCIISLFQYYFEWDFYPQSKPIAGTMVNKNLFSSAVFLLIPFPFYLLSKGKLVRYFSIIIISISILLIIMSQSRAVYISLFAFFICMIFIKKNKFKWKNILIIFSCLGFMLICEIGINISKHGINNLFDSYNKKIELNHTSNNERIDLWQSSLNLISDNFFIGVGPGNWKIQLPNYTNNHLKNENTLTRHNYSEGLIAFNRPHNDFLWVLSEQGILGLFIIFLLYLLIIKRGIKILSFYQFNTDEYKITVTIFSGFIGFLIISFFSYPSERVFHNLILIVYMSYFIRFYPKNIRLQLNRKYVNFVLLCLVLFSSLFSYSRYDYLVSNSKIRYFRHNSQWEKLITVYNDRTISFEILDNVGLPNSWYAGVGYFSLGKYSNAKELFLNAYDKNPNNPHVLNNLASVYTNLNDINLSIKYYKKAVELYPAFMDARINLAIIYFKNNQYLKSYKLLTAVPDIFINIEQETNYYKLKQILENKNEIQGYINEDY